MKHVLLFLAFAGVLGVQSGASADHASNSGVHWTKTTITYVDSVNGAWDAALVAGKDGWNAGLDDIGTRLVAGKSSVRERKRCAYITGRVHVCNYPYGNQGIWSGGVAGLAQYTYTLPSKHITKAKIRLNETNVPAGVEAAVTAHEMGHTLGLGHRPPEDVTSCMTPSVTVAQDSPDQHDYDAVNQRHQHLPHSGAAAADAPDPEKRVTRQGNEVTVTWAVFA